MKYLYLICFALTIFPAVAQQDVYLNIYHYLENQPFAFNQTASNDLDEDFQLDRLEYYVAEITLTYDGGQDTTIQDLWMLVDASENTEQFLGTFSFSTLESVSFGIGVQQSYNHLDPSTYPADHPLAPQLPSMHWGWLAGYRFVALEGKVGTNDPLEIHALGDVNYHLQTVSTAGVVNGNDLVIKLAADYTEALSIIPLTGGVVFHGETDEAAQLMTNFATKVFSEADASAGVANHENVQVNFYPNTVTTGDEVMASETNALCEKLVEHLRKDNA